MSSKLYFFKDKNNTIYCFTEEEIFHLEIPKEKLHIITNKKDIEYFINKCKQPTQNIIDQLKILNDNQIINELIIFNTLTRQNEITEQRLPYNISEKTIYFIEKNKHNTNLINIISQEDKTRISNKGFDLLYDFNKLVNGINPISNQKLHWYEEYKNQDLIFIFYAIFIICMQLFSDANHRTAKHLLKTYTNIENIDHLIYEIISSNRQICSQIYRKTSQHTTIAEQQKLFDFYENIPNLFSKILKK
jgi:hypothetical protein